MAFLAAVKRYFLRLILGSAKMLSELANFAPLEILGGLAL